MRARVFKIVLRVALIVFAIVLGYRLISLRSVSLDTEEQIKDVKEQIRSAKLKNAEYADILSEENEEDFYRNLAEENLGYGSAEEKVYQVISE